MTILKDTDVLAVPRLVEFERDGICFAADPDGPNWIATDRRGAFVLRLAVRKASVGEIASRCAAAWQTDAAKAWLHVRSFLGDALRSRIARTAQPERQPYSGRSAHWPGKLRELWIHTNNSCNLTCAHCLVGSSPAGDPGLATERLRDILEQASACGVERVYFTGGEPFARPDIFELIDFVTAGGAELVILTNATLFHGERLSRLERCSRDHLRLQISLDGACPETNDPLRGSGTFDRIREGTLAATRLGFQVSLTTVVTRENLAEIPEVTALARDWGARSQHLMWMHRRGRVVERMPDSFPAVAELIEMVRATRARAESLGIVIDNVESIRLRVDGRPFLKYDLGNQLWDSVCVYSDGAVYPSAAMANHAPLRAGVIRNGNLREIWEASEVARRFREATVARRDLAEDDPFRFILGGGDLEHGYFFSGGGSLENRLEAPDPYYPVYASIARDLMFELADVGRRAFNRRSGFDAPILYHAMGEGAVHCGAEPIDAHESVATLHSNCVLSFGVETSRAVVQEFYGVAAEEPQPALCCPSSYAAEDLDHIPREVIERFYGCGSPIALASVREGETVVDLGSGGGIDCFIAARKVGPVGRVIGIDMTDAMLDVARRNRGPVAERLGYDVVEFRRGYLEDVPVETGTVDIVTSNCVINLSPDKKAVFREMWRILKDHGRIVTSDIVSEEPVPPHLRVNRMLWGECISGALTEEEFLADLEQAGFYGLQVLKKSYWKEVEGYRFFSVTVRGYKFCKTAGCVFRGQRAVYLGPLKAVMDEEGHLFPRNEPVEVCTDTAAKLANPPYRGSFVLLEPGRSEEADYSCCAPGESCC